MATRIQNDCHLVQDGSAERVPIAASFIATFITGFALAYARSWRLALALSSILPVIMVFGALMFVVMTKIRYAHLLLLSASGNILTSTARSRWTLSRKAEPSPKRLSDQSELFRPSAPPRSWQTSIGNSSCCRTNYRRRGLQLKVVVWVSCVRPADCPLGHDI